jgi:hypothetical protein
MIPYDDLVAALSAWRARQGLPVNTIGGAAVSSGSGSFAAQPGSGPNRAGSGPNRAPPQPEPLEVSDELLDEAAYEPEGNDFAMAFGGGAEPEPTAVADAPERPTEMDMGNDREDW